MQSWFAAMAMLVCACRGSTHANITGGTAVARPAAPLGALSVKDFGAKGDGVTDDRAAIQAAIDAGAARRAVVFFPPGTYSVSTPRGAWGAVDVPAGVHLLGAGDGKTVLQQTSDAAPSANLLHVFGDDIVIEYVTLDGNNQKQTKNKHRHGIMANNTARLIVRHVTARNFTGDGFYLYNGVKDSLFVDVLATANDRNGITFGGTVDGTTLLDSKFIANHAEQVDSEPGGASIVSNTAISGCEIDGAGVSTDYALTISGTGVAQGTGWRVIGNTIRGGIAVVWAEHVLIFGNTGVNPTTKASVMVVRSSADVTIMGNRFELTQTSVPSLAAIYIGGRPRSAPERVVIFGNDIKLAYEKSFAVRAEGVLSVAVIGNVFRGAGRAAPSYAGIFLRATSTELDFRSAVIRGNTIRNFGSRGISVGGNGDARLLSLDITDNTFDDDSSVPSMTTAISLDDGTGAARRVSVSGNQCLHGVTIPVANYPRNAEVTVDGRRGSATQ